MPLLFAGVSAFLGVCLVILARQSSRHARLVDAVRTRRVGDLERVKPGRLVEVKGRVRCDEPLVASFSNRPCVYHRSEVERHYEDYRGHGSWESVESTVLHTPFLVEDRTGTVWVEPEGAQFDPRQVVKDYQPVGSRFRFGFVLGRLSPSSGRTIGMRYTEHVLAVDAPVYVLGVLGSNGVIRAPRDSSGGGALLISHRDEASFRGSLRRTAFWTTVGAPLCFLLALYLVVQAFR